MIPSATRPRATVPGTYASLLAAVVERWQISPEQLLEGSGIAPEQLLAPLWHLDYEVFRLLMERALALTGEPGLGFHLGMQMKVSCHGLIGFAAMIAKDVREALDVAQQFVRLQSSALSLRLEERGDTAFLYFDQVWPDCALGEVGSLFMLLGFALMGEAVTGRQLTGVGRFRFRRPDYFDRFEHLMPGTLRFEQAETCIEFPAEYLDLPLLMADPLAARLAREQCKRELSALAGTATVAGLVRELLYDEALGFCTMEAVAEKLHMSPRTLQRQLAQENKSFSAILNELREKKALVLLKRPELSLEYIAERLGYADVSNFTRAFRRWTGVAPGKWRG